MREILFRGKRVDTGAWVYGYFIKIADGTCLIVPEIATDWFTLAVRIHPETVGQYTGLEDEHGKRIFEGDVLRDEFVHNHVVTYKTEGFFEDEYEFSNGTGLCCHTEAQASIIIGNIHDNPELLEVSQ